MRSQLTFGLAATALLTLASSGPALAQAAVEARLAVALDALDPAAFESETRGTVEGSFAPEVVFASKRGRAYYQFDGGSFNTPGDWSFLSHALGASYRVDVAEAGRARLFVGGSGAWRRNGDAWSEADYDALGAFVNLELRPSAGSTLRTGYRLVGRAFAQLAKLDQLEQDAFASLNVHLPSRTTLIGESHFGWKSYEGETPNGVLPATEPSQGRHGAGMGPGVRSPLPAYVPTGASGEQAHQWNALARVAQGLGDRTGVWVQGFVRRTSGRVPPALVVTPAGFFDDGVYDDPFASNLGALSGGLKHVFVGGAELQASGAWQKKDFTGLVALDPTGLAVAGEPLRADRIVRGAVGWSLPLPDAGAFSWALGLEYAFVRSRSNDAFYDYRDHAVGLALTLSR